MALRMTWLPSIGTHSNFSSDIVPLTGDGGTIVISDIETQLLFLSRELESICRKDQACIGRMNNSWCVIRVGIAYIGHCPHSSLIRRLGTQSYHDGRIVQFGWFDLLFFGAIHFSAIEMPHKGGTIIKKTHVANVIIEVTVVEEA